MKELTLELGKIGGLKNKHNHLIKLKRNDKGYFVFCNSKSYGPFEKIFLSKTKEGDERIIGYNSNFSNVFHINEDVSVFEKQLSIDTLEQKSSNKISFKNCKTIDSLNGHSIFLDLENDCFFAVDQKNILQDSNLYPKFDNYADLIDFHKTAHNINLYNHEIYKKLEREKAILINFNKLEALLSNATVESFDFSILLDMLNNREIEKKIFNVYKDKIIAIAYSEQKINNLLNNGYKKTTATSLERLSITFKEETELFSALLKKKVEEISPKIIEFLKSTDDIDFDKLKLLMTTISIKDVSKKAGAEIGAKRPLTRQIFTDMLLACFDKLESETPIKDCYNNVANFKCIYPEQYDELWEIAKEKQPDLYNEYFAERKKAFSINA